jgi:hypothetical protein
MRQVVGDVPYPRALGDWKMYFLYHHFSSTANLIDDVPDGCI